MMLHVVVLQAMGGTDVACIFSREEDARACLHYRFKGEGYVSSCKVSGTPQNGIIYTANRYVPGDVHEFIGLHSNYDDAQRASGLHGIALRKVVDESLPVGA